MDEPLNEGNLPNILVQLRERSSNWKQIGRGLGFREGELNNIEATHNIKTAHDFLCAMLSKWLQFAPGDGRGSTEYATLRALRTAVDHAGFGRTAETLSVTAEANAHTSAERNGSAEGPRPKRPRLE